MCINNSGMYLVQNTVTLAGLKTAFTPAPSSHPRQQVHDDNRLFFSSVEMCCFIHFPPRPRRMARSRCFLPNMVTKIPTARSICTNFFWGGFPDPDTWFVHMLCSYNDNGHSDSKVSVGKDRLIKRMNIPYRRAYGIKSPYDCSF